MDFSIGKIRCGSAEVIQSDTLELRKQILTLHAVDFASVHGNGLSVWKARQ